MHKWANRILLMFSALVAITGCKPVRSVYYTDVALANGGIYTGYTRGNKAEGYGTLTFSSPHVRAGEEYVGDFRNGKVHGRGILTKSSPNPGAGAKFVGEFRDGKPHFGTVTTYPPHEEPGVKYVGQFRDGQANGEGTAAFSSPSKKAGEKYTGGFRNGDYHGHGTLTFTSPNKKAGDKYVGEFVGDKFHGKGTYTFASGRVQDGIWEKHLFKHARKVSPEVASRETPNSSSTPDASKKKEQLPRGETSGSGFFVSKLGHIVTNQHVVNGCKRITVGDTAQRQAAAIVLETDKRNDLALLKLTSTAMASTDTKSLIRKLGISIEARNIPLSSNGLLRSEDVELGERVMVSGYPYGEIFSDTIKVTGGMVSAIRGVGDDSGQFQIDAAVQPGNSGGPIYDENGNIVGVVISQLDKLKVAKAIGSLPENVNFGIKASTVRQFLTSAGLPTKSSKQEKLLSSRDLAKIAKTQTLMVVCHR
jgi:S1-C subfamily serine protease